MKKNLGATVLFMLMMLTYGCGSSGGDTPAPEDSEDPKISVSKPAEGATVMRGNDLLLTGTFTDDMELKDLTVTLSHTDTKVATGIKDPWEPAANPEVIALTGKDAELINHKLFGEKIPVDCKVGNYRLTLKLTDKAGKSVNKQINIVIGG